MQCYDMFNMNNIFGGLGSDIYVPHGPKVCGPRVITLLN